MVSDEERISYKIDMCWEPMRRSPDDNPEELEMGKIIYAGLGVDDRPISIIAKDFFGRPFKVCSRGIFM